MNNIIIKFLIVLVCIFASKCEMLTSEKTEISTVIKNDISEISSKQNQKESISNDKSPVSIKTPQFQVNPVENQNDKSRKQELTDLSENSDEIQWPQKDRYYIVFSALNPRLVLDVANAQDNVHDLILYPRGENLNQKFYFQKVRENFYRIGNGKYQKEYLQTSEKIMRLEEEIIQRVKFHSRNDQLWQLIPAKKNLPNSFFIVNEQGMALDVMNGYARPMSEIVQYKFHHHFNQIWFLRTDQKSIQITDENPQNYEQIFIEGLHNVITKPQSINEALLLEDMKFTLRRNNIELPESLRQPPKPHLESHDAPFPLKYKWFEQQVKQNQAMEESKQNQIDQKSEFMQNASLATKKSSPKSLKSQYIAMDCAKNNKIAYVWLGQKQMPLEYQELLNKCKNNTLLLKDEDFLSYKQKWNTLPHEKKIPEDLPIRQQVNMVKLLYLYFESGIYADFDTQINEVCWDEVYTDEMIFSNRIDDSVRDVIVLPVEEIVVPEESFMMVRNKLNPQVKRMIEEEILEHNYGGGDRWKECKYRQCLILECQRHYRDNTYKKGYD